MSSMWWDIGLQLFFLIAGGLMFLWTNDIPRKLLNKYNTYRDRSKHLARQHFVKSANLVSKSKSHPRFSPQSITFAKQATIEADVAVNLDPSDAAFHIIRGVSLQLQGFNTSALDSFSIALSPVAVKSLSDEERGDAIVKRAELRMEVSRIGGESDESVLSLVEVELREAVALRKESGYAWCLLGQCCEKLGKVESAREAFEEAVRVEPDSVVATQGLQRLS